MHLRDAFSKHRTTFSFEFFPPKTEPAAAELFESLRALEPLKPTFVSVTYGAGGSTRQLTHELVERVKAETTLDPMAHLTGVGHTEAEIEAILMRYAKAQLAATYSTMAPWLSRPQNSTTAVPTTAPRPGP